MAKTIEKRPSVDEILTRYNYLTGVYTPRNNEYGILRNAFDGVFNRRGTKTGLPGEQIESADLESMFGDNIKIVYNIVNATVRRYMDSMSAQPRIEAMPSGLEADDVAGADARSKWLEGLWLANNMELKLPMAGYYQSLLDRAIWNVRPCPDHSWGIKIDLGIPDNFFPMPSGDDWSKFPFEIYAFRKFDPEDIAIDPTSQQFTTRFHNVVEYWSPNWFIRIEDNVEKVAIQHNLKRSAWPQAHNIPIPHRYRGQSDVDQAIGLNQYLNLLLSDQADIINYAANPITVVRGSEVDPRNLPFSPRAVWALGREGQAQFLQWAGSPPTVEGQVLRTIQAIEDTTGASSPTFGREIPSGTSGSAVRSLLAGFNSRIGTKQQLMGASLVQANEIAMQFAENEYPNREYEIMGENGKKSKGPQVIKPKEFKGWYKNRVIFDPFDKASRFFQELEKMEKKLQSRKTTMTNMGIPNPSDELKQMRLEAAEELERVNQQAQAEQGELPPGAPALVPPPPEQAPLPQVPQIAAGGGAPPAPRPEMPNPEQQARVDKLFPGLTGGKKEEPFTPKESTDEKKVGLGDVMQSLRKLPRLSRPAALAGEIANTGSTERMIDIIAPGAGDRKKIKRVLGKLGRRVNFVNPDDRPGKTIDISGRR